MKFALIIISQLCLISVAFAGGEVGNGGDDIGLEFTTDASTAYKFLLSDKENLLRDISGIEGVIGRTRIVVGDQPLLVSFDGVIQQSVAVNQASDLLITIDRNRWQQISDPIIKQAIAIHEVLGLLNVEHTGEYPISSQFVIKMGGSSETLRRSALWPNVPSNLNNSLQGQLIALDQNSGEILGFDNSGNLKGSFNLDKIACGTDSSCRASNFKLKYTRQGALRHFFVGYSTLQDNSSTDYLMQVNHDGTISIGPQSETWFSQGLITNGIEVGNNYISATRDSEFADGSSRFHFRLFDVFSNENGDVFLNENDTDYPEKGRCGVIDPYTIQLTSVGDKEFAILGRSNGQFGLFSINSSQVICESSLTLPLIQSQNANVTDFKFIPSSNLFIYENVDVEKKQVQFLSSKLIDGKLLKPELLVTRSFLGPKPDVTSMSVDNSEGRFFYFSTETAIFQFDLITNKLTQLASRPGGKIVSIEFIK